MNNAAVGEPRDGSWEDEGRRTSKDKQERVHWQRINQWSM